ncbi:MAG: hypothetical protein ABSB75_00405, partial [Candidatus Limnocylindrales bacterium]
TWPRDSFTGEIDAILFEPTGRATVEVAGKSHYQGALESVAGGRTIDGARNRDHLAVLLPEPWSPYDPNAVRVFVGPPWARSGIYPARMPSSIGPRSSEPRALGK